jgi:acyl-CoA synthetase (AMP-forming)/AMP-acid ligase II
MECSAVLQYTSGSTSNPRGVVVTHANVMANFRNCAEGMGLDERSVFVSWLPVFHDMGLFGGLLEGFYCGGHTVLMPRNTILRNPLSWLRAISKYRGTLSGAPNFACEACVAAVNRRKPPELDLCCWLTAFNGAEPIRARTLEKFAASFAPFGFRSEFLYPTYGLAEVTLFVTGSRSGCTPVVRRFEGIEGSRLDRLEGDLVSSGRPVCDTVVRIVDPEKRKPLPEGSVGEVWVSGPHVARHYWNNSAASESLQAVLEAEGDRPFLRTGDLGFLDNGELFITGRVSDVINWRGQNLYPQDLENRACNAHAGIEPGCAAAFSISDEVVPRVVMVLGLRKGREAGDPLEISETVKRILWTAFDVTLHALVLVPRSEVARTSSGKIRRRSVRAAYTGKQLTVLHESIRQSSWMPDPKPGDRLGALSVKKSETPRNQRPGVVVKPGVTSQDPGVSENERLTSIVSAIWTDVLNLTHVDRTANFFDSGCHSLLALKVVGRIESDLGGDFRRERCIRRPASTPWSR